MHPAGFPPGRELFAELDRRRRGDAGGSYSCHSTRWPRLGRGHRATARGDGGRLSSWRRTGRCVLVRFRAAADLRRTVPTARLFITNTQRSRARCLQSSGVREATHHRTSEPGVDRPCRNAWQRPRRSPAVVRRITVAVPTLTNLALATGNHRLPQPVLVPERPPQPGSPPDDLERAAQPDSTLY